MFCLCPWLSWGFVDVSLVLPGAGPLSGGVAGAPHCGGFSGWEAQALGALASVVEAGGLSSCSSWTLELSTGSVLMVHGLSCSATLGSSRNRAQTRFPCLVSGFFTSHQGRTPTKKHFLKEELKKANQGYCSAHAGSQHTRLPLVRWKPSSFLGRVTQTFSPGASSISALPALSSCH